MTHPPGRRTVPPPPRMPSFGASGNGRMVGLGALVVALANAPAFVAWATPKPQEAPAATRADIESLRVDMRAMQFTLDEMRKENDKRIRDLERVTDRLAALRPGLSGQH